MKLYSVGIEKHAMQTTTQTAKPRLSIRANGQHKVSYRGQQVTLMDDGCYGRKVVAFDEHGHGDTQAVGQDDAVAVGVWVRGLDHAAELEAAKAKKPGKTSDHIVDGFAVTITKNGSIRIRGERYGKPVDVTYGMGDTAEYDSWNLSYMGEIMSITPKTVTIRETHPGAKKHRLKVAEFVSRNAGGLESKFKNNREWYD